MKKNKQDFYSKFQLLLLFIGFIIIERTSACEIFSGDSILRIQKTAKFEINGKGDNPAWQRTSWIKLTRSSDKVDYQTELKILYSDSGIYCLYNCSDAKISATLKGDFLDLFKEDVVEVFFWPDDTVPIYFEYELSPLNYELPILVPNMNGKFFGWRPWHYELKKTIHAVNIARNSLTPSLVTGWNAEFFIPFSLFKPLCNVPPSKGTFWRANFYRIDYDNGNCDWYWQAFRTNFHDYKMFGRILFD